MLEAIAEPIVADGVLLTLRASVGVAMFPDDATEAALLFERADIALHQAMRSADPIVSYCAGTDPNSADRLRLVGELRVAVDRGELEVFYQPLVSVANGTVVAVEALVRWHHPRRGLVAPDEFIPLAEHTGLIFPLTVVVLEQAVRQCRVWRDEGRMITMAVNISARSLDDPLLPTVLEAVLERWSVPADAIMIEVTETALASDVEVAVDALERLKRIGVRIALDDFGTGFSSLVQLRLLPIDEIKIDRSFVSRMVDADLDFQIVRALVELGPASVSSSSPKASRHHASRSISTPWAATSRRATCSAARCRPPRPTVGPGRERPRCATARDRTPVRPAADRTRRTRRSR